MNNIINHLSKSQYLLLKEKDFAQRELEVRKMIEEQTEEDRKKQEERDKLDEDNSGESNEE
ncbi:MAG: hypothetical protein GF401_06420 [Chitinivibrionales bacterium]|nr:hypothetical protein [Chitinivibrionales bacterium]